MKIVSVVGARPEFIQSGPVSRALRRTHEELLVHTGQHYDYVMSQTFFDELGIPAPDYNLGVGTAPSAAGQARQTAEIMAGIEQVLLDVQPDLVIVRGDTNSTLGGALAAAKLHIPTAHIEAGERSFDRRMPEEINRLVADRLADRHLCVSRTAVRNLAGEGITDSAVWVGDVMLDALLANKPLAHRDSRVLERLHLKRQGYALVTVHRAANTDDPVRLGSIMAALRHAPEPVVFPMHPRTRKAVERLSIMPAPHVHLVEAVGYLDMLVLEENARLIATDSGGVQREAYFLGVPCLTLRDETEWQETVTAGWNRLVGVEPERVLAEWTSFAPSQERPPIFGDGTAAERIAANLTEARVVFGATAVGGGPAVALPVLDGRLVGVGLEAPQAAAGRQS